MINTATEIQTESMKTETTDYKIEAKPTNDQQTGFRSDDVWT